MGSALRIVVTDYGPAPILADALEAARIANRGPLGPLPLKESMANREQVEATGRAVLTVPSPTHVGEGM